MSQISTDFRSISGLNWVESPITLALMGKEGMASVWGELKRRNVVKVAVAYAIVGWLLIEIASTVFPIVQLPDWTVTFLTMLILFGFPWH